MLNSVVEPKGEVSKLLLCKWPDHKHSRHCGTGGLCHSYPTLPPKCENNHGLYGHEWVLLCSNKALFTESGGGLDVAPSP